MSDTIRFIECEGFLPPHDAMPWFREPQVILSRLVGLSTTLSALWFCRKVGCWAKSLGRLGALILRFVRRGRLSRRPPDYGHLLMIPLYPGVRVVLEGVDVFNAIESLQAVRIHEKTSLHVQETLLHFKPPVSRKVWQRKLGPQGARMKLSLCSVKPCC